MKKQKNKSLKKKRIKLFELLDESPFGIPSYHFRFVVESNRAPKSAVQCDFVSLVTNPERNKFNYNKCY